MEKFLRKWVRKFHRWLVLPFIALMLTVIFTRGTQVGNIAQRIQAPILIIMAISGLYLYLLPHWSKWKYRKAKEMKSSGTED